MIKVVSHIVVVTWVLWTILCPPAVALPKDAAYHLEDYAAPWAAPAHIKFAYQGLHNDLRALLAQQAMRQSISVTFFTAAQRPMLLNCLYSLVNYGRALNYIVVTIDHTSLNECLRLRLPCYNATHMLGDLASEKDSSFGSPQYRKLVHSKPGIVWEVLHLGLNVHFTDVDVSFLRRVWPSYNRLLQKTGADMVFMNEFTHLNTGNFVIRYNERTVSAVRAWATAAPEREMYALSVSSYLIIVVHPAPSSTWCMRTLSFIMTDMLWYWLAVFIYIEFPYTEHSIGTWNPHTLLMPFSLNPCALSGTSQTRNGSSACVASTMNCVRTR